MDKKIKPLTIQQIIISLERLTRFKPTEEKYLRVFKDIILSSCIFPKLKKIQLERIDYKEITNLAEEIFNFSLNYLNIPLSGDYTINKKLLEYEKSIFIFDENIEKLLENKIDYKGALNLLNKDNLPLNLKWLKSLSENKNQIASRVKFAIKYPIEKIILAEGITEEILLPKFGQIYGLDFDKAGIHLISAGGKKQVVKLFYKYADILKLPVFILLDKDAKENFEDIKPKLRPGDKVHILKNGEFEDILSLNLIKRTLNRYPQNFSSVILDDLRKNLPMTRILEELFKERKLEFKKAEFASQVLLNISCEKDVSEEIKNIFKELEKQFSLW